jgi:periplasmic protein TonB
MSYFLNNQQKFNDVVFENRNKNYGAYAIRSAYGNTVFKSLLTVCLTSCTFAFIAYLLTRQLAEAPAIAEQIPPDVITTVYLPPEETPEPRSAQPPRPDATPPPASSSIFGTRIVDTLPVETSSQNTQENIPALASTVSGTASSAIAPNPGSGGQGAGSTTGSESIPAGNEAVLFADSEPEFEGGLRALHQFVASRLRYPQRAIEEGKEGTVHVKFIVDEKGKVGNITLQNHLGFGLDEEAQRVVSMIPDFKAPAKVNGKPVKMYYQLPIRFKYR